MKNIIKKGIPVLLLIVILFSGLLYFKFNQVGSNGNGYLPSEVLGQNDFESRYSDNIYPTNLSMRYPQDTVVDSTNHKLYVADSAQYRILVFNLDNSNQPVDSIADYVLGQSDFESDASCPVSPNASTFCGPVSLAIDPVSQTLFVSDFLNNRILIFDVSTITNGEAAVGVLGQTLFTTNVAATTQSGLNQPNGIDFDTVNNRLFVADDNNARILVMNFDPESYTNGQNFDFVLGRANFTTGGSCPVASSTSMCHPYDVVFNANDNKLYVADHYYQRVLVFDASVAELSNNDPAINVLGQSNFTGTSSFAGLGINSPKGFYNPLSVEVDEDSSRLFVSDEQNRVYIFDISAITDFEDATNVIGQSSFSSHQCDTTVSAGVLCNPVGLSYAQTNDTLYLADRSRHRILGFELSSITDGENAISLIGQTDFLTAYDNYISKPNANGFDGPYAGSFDTKNNRYFAVDNENNRVLVYNTNSTGNLLDNVPDYVIGQEDFESLEQECTSTISTICFPEDLEVDSVGERLFLSDSGHNRILVYDISDSNIENGMLPQYVIGQPDFDTYNNSNTTDKDFSYVYMLAYDSVDKYLYVSDDGNDRVLGFNVDENNIENYMSADRVFGQVNFTNSYNDTTASEFDSPSGLAVDESKRLLFVSDEDNNRVMVFDISDGNYSHGMNAEYVLSQQDFESSSCFEMSPCGARDLSIDPQSDLLYVADSQDSRILVYDIDLNSLSIGLEPMAVIGQQSFSESSCNLGVTEIPYSYTLCYPNGVTVNPENGDLYISDSSNNRILKYEFARLSQTTLASGESGQSYSQSLTIENDQGDTEISLFSGTLPTGLTLGASSITGTPTTTGKYNFTLEVLDDNGTNGVFRQLQEYTILIDPELIDTDGDGITDVIEQASPNSGDANDDNIQDSLQDNVTVLVNPVTDNYVVLESSCNSNDSVDVDPNSNDEAFSYPFGMIEFIINCTNPGDSATVQLIYFENEDANQFVLRKFDGTNYDTIGDYTIQEGTLDGEDIITVTYNIIDGGILDQDGVANGTIVDPVGLAEDSTGTPNTGLGGSVVYSR